MRLSTPIPRSYRYIFAEYRGTSGPQSVSRLRSNRFVSSILQSAKELGLIVNEDYNGESQEGMILLSMYVHTLHVLDCSLDIPSKDHCSDDVDLAQLYISGRQCWSIGLAHL